MIETVKLHMKSDAKYKKQLLKTLEISIKITDRYIQIS